MKKSFLKITGLLLCLVVITLAAAGWYAYQHLTHFIATPFDPSGKDKIFTIESGRSLSQIAQDMEQHQLISSARYFKWYAIYEKAGTRLQAGEYLLSGAQTPRQILATLLKGRVKLYRLTIPEGWNMKEIATAVETLGACPADTFILKCSDPKWFAQNHISAASLEGYLFPDTYFFPKNTSCDRIIQTMVQRFKKQFTPQMEEKAKAIGFTTHEIITLASIIEKETGDASERPVISSVFHNRLKKRMRLESDPTVIYGIKDFDGNIKRIHLRTWTPYNTYQIRGLPPGPIASPGIESLMAALYPDKTDFLFFVSKKNATHHFSKTMDEHNRAVRKYQLRHH